MRKIRAAWLAFAFVLVLGLAAGYAADALAQTQPQAVNTGLDFASGTGLSAQNPKATAVKVIRIGLGFLGIIAVGLIIYAGFLWMSAKGNEEKIEQAKKILIGAVIGFVIILAAFGIASFILGKLLGATGGGTGGNSNGGGFGTGGDDPFAVRGATPALKSVNVPRNAVIRVQFSKNVQPSSVTANSFTVTDEGKPVAGTRSVAGSIIEFVPNQSCEAPNDKQKCFPADTLIQFDLKNSKQAVQESSTSLAVTTVDEKGIISVNSEQLSCSGSSTCTFVFTTGDFVDTSAPRVNLTTAQVCVSSDNALQASAIDDYGVSKIDFYAAGQLIGSRLNNSYPFVPSPYSATLSWNPGGATVGQNVLLKATAYDLDSNSASAEKTLRLSADHCCNGIQDGDETGPDCGGGCLACIGQACAAPGSQPPVCSADLCSSAFCAAGGTKGDCSCQAHPRISWISPAGGFCANDANKPCSANADCGANTQCNTGTPNGAGGNLVTISGEGFGTVPGKVYFKGASGRIEAVLANDPEQGNPSCGAQVWSDSEIVAIVPAAAADGAIAIETKSGVSDATDDAFGPLINDFKKNTIDRPGLCLINPFKGRVEVPVTYNGLKLAASKAYFGKQNDAEQVIGLEPNSFTQATAGSARVPNLIAGQTTTYVRNGKVASNYLAFTKDKEPYDGPTIASIDPLSGPIGQYVTIRGSGFGGTRGTSKVYFGDTSGSQADYSFPDACATSVWNDKQIIVKVPQGIAQNSYKITVARDGFPPVDSGSAQFQVTAGSPAPGLCRIDPAFGQANSSVTLWGEYFQTKDQNSSVSFNGSPTPQGGTAISFWDIDRSAGGIKPWKVVVTVPGSAASGPVRVNAGSPAVSSNGINFGVGTCTQDADCGSGAFCCASGLPEAGKCKSDSAQCYGTAATSVYEWQFATGTTAPQCQGDQPNTCGSVCCAGPCDPTTPNKCQACLATQNECGNGQCCNLGCVTPPGGTQSTCPDPDSCGGYNNLQCVEGFFCPNSPGHCTPTIAQPAGEAMCKCCCDKRENNKETGENPACCSGNGLTCANSCGATDTNMGVCAGCAPDGVPSTANDEKCNCVGTTGKFCAVNAANPTGFCADCSSITDPVECSSHTQCCVDGRPGQGGKCVSVVKNQPRVPGTPTLGGDIFGDLNGNAKNAPGNGNGTPTLQYCGFFSCKGVNGQNTCNNQPAKDGQYKLLTECTANCATQEIPCSTKNNCAEPKCDGDAHCDMASCTCKPNTQPPQDPCKNPITQQCTITCSKGYECRTPQAAAGATTAVGQETPDNTCRCCCKPPTAEDPTDTCKDLDPDLSCLANQDACTGANRGACCGCTKDAQCGDTPTTGCGQTGSDCCRARPMVAQRYPASNATNVCRNPAIEALFNQKMELASFTSNVLLVGDYEGSECPSDSTPVTMSQPATRFARLVLPFKKILARVAPILLPKDAVAETNNYCIVAGSPVGSDVDSTASKVSYRLTKPLDANRRYFVVVQGDPALAALSQDNQKQYYDAKVRSLSLIGMTVVPGKLPPGVPEYFTSTKYPNAEIWTFKTGADICAVDSVSVSPSFYLFQRSGDANGKVLNANANARGQEISPIPGVYDWTWNWASADSSIVRLEGEAGQAATLAIAGNKKDAQTSAQATVTITADSGTRTVGRKVQGSAQLRVFLCENPWPVYYSFMPPPGYVWPWRDATTGIEFYYCRDANGPGTSDDLPAIKDAPLTPASGRRVCMIGANKGKTCTSDTECSVVGSCWPEVLKEYFFFRDTQPVTPVLSGTVAAEGSKVTLNWAATQYATKYKIYYGTGRGQYSRTIDVPSSATAMAKTIEGLANGVKYYFAVTALSDKNQETAYSNEVSLTPLDTIAPDKPTVTGSGGAGSGTPTTNGEIALFWSPVPDAVSYIAYLGNQPRSGNSQYLTSRPVSAVPAANQPNTVFTNLNPGNTYYLAVRSVDLYGNMSDYSTEIEVRPNRPFLVSAVPTSRGIRLRWLPFKGAQGYQINLRVGDKGEPLAPITVSGTTLEYDVTRIPAGDYVFSITVQKASNVLSEQSNEQRASFGSQK